MPQSHAHFEAVLAPGGKVPYDQWVFVVFPEEVVASWGGGGTRPVGRHPVRRHPVCGTLAGVPFRGTASRGEGVVRMPVTAALRAEAGVAVGDRVRVAVALDPSPRPVHVPAELQSVLDEDDVLAAAFDDLAPSCRRAWATHVAEAKRPETRVKRADAAREGIARRRFPGQKG
jgi:hypothetical protein